MSTVSDLQQSRESQLQQSNTGGSFYDAQSAERQSKISMPDTTGDTSAGREARLNAMPDTTGDTSAGREARLNARPDFNATFKTDQRGNRTATPNRPSKDVRDILSKGGPTNAKEQTRMRRFAGTTAGKAFDFGKFNQTLNKTRRGFLGQMETERQMEQFHASQSGGGPQAAEINPSGSAQEIDADPTVERAIPAVMPPQTIETPDLKDATDADLAADLADDFSVDTEDAGSILSVDTTNPAIADSILS